jgi:hypothetical protein
VIEFKAPEDSPLTHTLSAALYQLCLARKAAIEGGLPQHLLHQIDRTINAIVDSILALTEPPKPVRLCSCPGRPYGVHTGTCALVEARPFA